MWYRPPEMLFGAQRYGPAVDIWSMGCVFAELLLRRPIFPGTSDMDQLQKIAIIMGSPDESNWPGVTNIRNYFPIEVQPPPPLASHFPAASKEAIALITSMLQLCPERRISAREALAHPYFHQDTMPKETPLADLPRPK